MVMCPVTRAVDLTLPFMIVPHDYVGAATAYVKTPGVGVEIIMLNVRWLGGMAMGKTKVANNVTHSGQGIVQDGNDMGPLIPQMEIVPAPDNILSFVHLLTSSCTVVFSAGDVQAQGTPVATIMPFLMPMKNCANPITVPFGYSVTNVMNTVFVYPHIVDILAGWADIIATIIVDAIVAASSPPDPTGAGSAGQAALSAITEAILGEAPSVGEAAKQNIPGIASGLVRLAGRFLCSDYDGPVSIQVGYNQGMLGGGGYQVGYGSDGSVSHGPTWQTAGGGYSGGHETSHAPDGTTTTTDTHQVGGAGQSTSSRSVAPDGTVTETDTRTDNEWGGSRTRTTERTTNPDGSVTETTSRTHEQNTPLLGTHRSSSNRTTETTTGPDGRSTRETTQSRSRGGRVVSSQTTRSRSGERVL